MEESLHMIVDVQKLIVPVRVVFTFTSFLIALKAVFQFVKQKSHGGRSDFLSLPIEFTGKESCAFRACA